jgi:hypothetical protein
MDGRFDGFIIALCAGFARIGNRLDAKSGAKAGWQIFLAWLIDDNRVELCGRRLSPSL